MKHKTQLAALLFTLMATITGTVKVFAQADMKKTIAMIKTNLATSKANLKTYEWIETTTTFIKGKEKSKKQNQCYYSVDGKLTKVSTAATTPEKKKGGLRGKIIENKKEEMADYVKAAIAKIQTYIPPASAKLQKIYGDGKAAIAVLEPGKKFKLSFPDYNEQGDMLTMSVDVEKRMLLGMSVSTSIDKPSEKVVFDLNYSTLPDNTQYPSNITLDATAKNLKIVMENSGYKKGAGHL
jgi:hypothetical protein